MKQQNTLDVNVQNGSLAIPAGYRPFLGLRKTEEAIRFIKEYFQISLARALNLTRVSSPLFVASGTGINDHLNGIERPVSFEIKDTGQRAEIVQSLAKWKRMALADYGFAHGDGLFTDMNAIRPDEVLDNLHSIYVDQWDWERIVLAAERNVDFLKGIVRAIYGVITATERAVCERYPELPSPALPDDIFFIHTEELEERYPALTPKERESAITAEKKAVFVIGSGAELSNGKPHDGRAADYDDWSTVTSDGRRGLNGDIFVWHPILNCAFELSSMGIRVDSESLINQLEIRGENFKKELYFHKRLIDGTLPLTIGGGLGQSRLCMFFLRKAHIGEVHSSIWPDEMKAACRENGIPLL